MYYVEFSYKGCRSKEVYSFESSWERFTFIEAMANEMKFSGIKVRIWNSPVIGAIYKGLEFLDERSLCDI